MYLGCGGFVLKTPLINLLINGCSDIPGNPGSIAIVFSAVRPMHTDVQPIPELYIPEEFYNVIYMWLKWISLPLTTKVFPSLENCSISTFGCFSP